MFHQLCKRVEGIIWPVLLVITLLSLLFGWLTIRFASDDIPTDNEGKWQEEMRSLTRQKLFLEASIQLAKSDSIGLLVDLNGRMVYLRLNGVKLHAIPILNVIRDEFFESLDAPAYASLFSLPVSVEKQSASVEKEPLVLIHAPKDTAEAANSLFIPDTSKVYPVYVSLAMQNGWKLIIREVSGSRQKSCWDSWKVRGRLIISRLSGLGVVAEHQPSVTIEVPVKEGEAIYRALPFHPQVVIRF